MDSLETFLITSFQNVRSSRRTDRLHRVLLEKVLENKPEWRDYSWRFEYTLPEDGFGGTFSIDIAAFEQEALKVCILAKAINSSVNKNIKNFANTTIGESARIMHAPNRTQLEKVLFISIHPREAPRFNNSGEVVGIDNVLSAKSRTKLNDVLLAQYDGIVEAKDVYYDINGIREKTNRSEFSTITIENLDRLDI